VILLVIAVLLSCPSAEWARSVASAQHDATTLKTLASNVCAPARRGRGVSGSANRNRCRDFWAANAPFLPAEGLKNLYGGIRAFPRQFPHTDDAAEYTSGNDPAKPSDMVLKVYVSAR
jgi:hypothetical protein